MVEPVFRVAGLSKAFGATTILSGIDLELPPSSVTVLTGRSGSGKSTLFKILAGLDKPSAGSIVIEGVDVASLSDDEFASLRLRKMGLVFQSFNLLPSLTAVENVRLPLDISGVPRKDAQRRAYDLLSLVGLTHRADARPNALSGGEQQRVAIARALTNDPAILLADEPTANLDRANGALVFDLLESIHRKLGTTILLITHDELAAHRWPRQFVLDDGRLSAAPAVRAAP